MKNFGKLRIPPPDKGLTASYEAKSWKELTQEWQIQMYLTYPGTDKPVDLPGIFISYPPNQSTHLILIPMG